MADAAVQFLLDQVAEVVKGYNDLISGAENEFQQLNNDLKVLKATLSDAARKTNKNKVYMELERQIREVVYDIEDTIDTCLTDVAKSNVRRLFDLHHVKMAKEVKALRVEKVKPMLDNASKMGSVQGRGAGAEEHPTTTRKVQTVRQDKIVVLHDQEDIIINHLRTPTEGLNVVSVIGMPGLGKTTTAWNIFRNADLSYEFPIRIWVYVAEKSNREVFLNILQKFSSQDMSKLEDQNLVQAVRSYLEKEKFLLVLDDVPNTKAWGDIKYALPETNAGGKVLITTRETKVGNCASPTRSHNLRFFDREESWTLLSFEAYKNVQEPPPELEGTGRAIAYKCGGVPLTIVVIGGILGDHLVTQQAAYAVQKEWERVLANVDLVLQSEEQIPDVVALSYDRLPDNLRECFVYLGSFPKAHEIPAWTLTRLWIAEGFVQKEKGKSLEETAEDYLNDFINRNLVIAEKTTPLGEVKVCRVHDMIRAFCQKKAKEHNLFEEISMREFDPSKIEEIHRLCLHSEVNKFLSAKPKGPHVRSFLCFSKEAIEVDKKNTLIIPDNFKLLRVLESKSIKFHQFPGKLPKQIHLRYITLSIDNLAMLPEAISQLWNLQTIVVNTKSRSITMNANIWKMARLRHLRTNAAIVLEKWEGEGGENLQTLNRLSPESCTVALSQRASNLKTLGIYGKLVALFKNLSLENLLHLENLKLVSAPINELPFEARPQGLPQRDRFPPNLTRLTLSKTFLDWSHMLKLEMIETLEVLKLKENAFTGPTWNVVHGFKSLQFLLIVSTDLVDWKASTNSFPNLRCLVLKNCENLKGIPECLSEAKDFKKLEIECVSESAVSSAKKIETAKKNESGHQLGGPFKLDIGPSTKSKDQAQK